MNNPWSISVLIISTVLILFAIFSRKLHRMHKRDVEKLKNENDSLSKEEKSTKKKTEGLVISLIALFTSVG